MLWVNHSAAWKTAADAVRDFLQTLTSTGGRVVTMTQTWDKGYLITFIVYETERVPES